MVMLLNDLNFFVAFTIVRIVWQAAVVGFYILPLLIAISQLSWFAFGVAAVGLLLILVTCTLTLLWYGLMIRMFVRRIKSESAPQNRRRSRRAE